MTKALKIIMGIEAANCSSCIYLDDVGDGGDYSYESILVCDINDGYGNLKSFPFKKNMDCCVVHFWATRFPEIIKGGHDSEVDQALINFVQAYDIAIGLDSQWGLL